MFEKLFMLVKNNAGMAVVQNPMIPAKYHEAVMNEASSSIIEVLKNQMESGKLKDMVKYFQFPGIYNNPLINSTVNRFANKLNKFYGIEPAVAMQIAKELIPPVMQEMIEQSKNDQDTDFSLSKLLAMLSGNNNMNNLLSQLAVA
jgi:hypothetical protein